jgi:hypothetical protein
MNPASRIAALYGPNSPRTFAEDMQAHMVNGYVYAGPDLFMLVRPVASVAYIKDPDLIRNPWCSFEPEACDTWFIYAAATARPTTALGLVKTCLTKMPFPLPLAAWERQAKGRTAIKFFSISRLVEVLCRSSAASST